MVRFVSHRLARSGMIAILVLCSGCSKNSSSTAREETVPANEALEIFHAMVAAYRQAHAYADNAVLHFRSVARADHMVRDEPPQNMAISFERPNRLRLVNQVFDESGQLIGSCHVVANGTILRASLPDHPDQILELDAPAQFNTGNMIPSGPVREAVLPLPLADLYPQLDLLISDPSQAPGDDPNRFQRLEDQSVDGHACRRIQVSGGTGRRVYWIDRKSHLLRRLDLPTRSMKQAIDPQDQLERIELWIEFRDAMFCDSIPNEAFTMEVPPAAVRVRELVPPLPNPLPPIIGQRAPDFTWTDSQGDPFRRDSLAGKVVVLDFWFTSCSPCQQSMPALEKIYERYAENDQVVFLAVSTDPATTPTDAIEQRLREWGARYPLVRDADQNMTMQFQIPGFPTVVLIGPDGILHGFEVGARTDYAPLAEAIDALLRGVNIAQRMIDDYEAQRRQYEANLASVAIDRHEIQVEITPAKIAARTEPAHHRLEPIWQAKDIHRPGNLLVIPGFKPDASAPDPPRFLVIAGDRTLVEMALDGQEIDRQELDLPPGEIVTFLRTTTRSHGDRIFVASGVGRQQLHLFDANWQRLLSFPKERDARISDVQFADLDGDREPEIHVGYWGDMGVQGVSLTGQRLWAERAISHVVQLAVQPDDTPGRDLLWCTHSRGTLLPIDHRGHRPEIAVRDRAMIHLATADLNFDGVTEWCGLAAAAEPGQYEAVGLDPAGNVVWSYPLPHGEYSNQVERIVAAPMAEGGFWILSAADGSIHALTADGKPVDRFNHGTAVTGLALIPSAEEAILLVSDPEALTAWKVVSKEK